MAQSLSESSVGPRVKGLYRFLGRNTNFNQLYDAATPWESHELSKNQSALIIVVVFFIAIQWFGCEARGCVISQLFCYKLHCWGLLWVIITV